MWIHDISEPEPRWIGQPEGPGLGDRVERTIDAVSLGTAKPIAQALAHALGLDDCGCDARREMLNRWEAQARRWWRGDDD